MRTASPVTSGLAAAALLSACSYDTPVEPELPASFAVTAAPSTAMMEQVGDLIFHDEDLSINKNQSCASCHDEGWGGTGPIIAINEAGSVYEGSIPGRFGDREGSQVASSGRHTRGRAAAGPHDGDEERTPRAPVASFGA